MLNKGHSDSHHAINNVTKNTLCCMTDTTIYRITNVEL